MWHMHPFQMFFWISTYVGTLYFILTSKNSRTNLTPEHQKISLCVSSLASERSKSSLISSKTLFIATTFLAQLVTRARGRPTPKLQAKSPRLQHASSAQVCTASIVKKSPSAVEILPRFESKPPFYAQFWSSWVPKSPRRLSSSSEESTKTIL